MAKKKKKDEKTAKKTHFLLIFVVIFLICGCVGGYFLGDHLVKNDKFELIGEKTITLNVGESYIEQGVNVVAFGKKVKSDKIKITNNVDTSKAGSYYVKYTTSNLRFFNVTRYRTVIVLESEVDA